MKQYFTKFGILAAMLSTFVQAFAYDFEVDDRYYTMISLPELTCELAEGDYEYEGDFIIPEKVTFKGKQITVTKIGSEAFKDCTSLTSVKIPNSVTKIGIEAFKGCTSLTSVKIPNSVIEIGGDAFEDCTSLTSIEIPNSVTEIGWCAFRDCTSLTSIEIPNSVTKIGWGAFKGCTSLTSVKIPNSVTSIEEYAFEGCTSLTSIKIPNSVTSIEKNAFNGCTSLTSVQLSDSLTQLGVGAFSQCSSLPCISIPGSVSNIRTGTYGWTGPFDACTSLKEMEIEYNDESFQTDGCLFYNSYRDKEPIPLESLIIDRELSIYKPYAPSAIPTLKKYTMGEHIKKNQFNLSESPDLDTITSYATTPPVLGNLTNSQYMNVKVFVPQESLEAYQNAEGWKNFWDMSGFDTAGGK